MARVHRITAATKEPQLEELPEYAIETQLKLVDSYREKFNVENTAAFSSATTSKPADECLHLQNTIDTLFTQITDALKYRIIELQREEWKYDQ